MLYMDNICIQLVQLHLFHKYVFLAFSFLLNTGNYSMRHCHNTCPLTYIWVLSCISLLIFLLQGEVTIGGSIHINWCIPEPEHVFLHLHNQLVG